MIYGQYRKIQDTMEQTMYNLTGTRRHTPPLWQLRPVKIENPHRCMIIVNTAWYVLVLACIAVCNDCISSPYCCAVFCNFSTCSQRFCIVGFLVFMVVVLFIPVKCSGPMEATVHKIL
jgi:hypothetical protein